MNEPPRLTGRCVPGGRGDWSVTAAIEHGQQGDKAGPAAVACALVDGTMGQGISDVFVLGRCIAEGWAACEAGEGVSTEELKHDLGLT